MFPTDGTGGSSNLTMTSSRPYIVKALHEWIVDNNLTPYLLVNALAQGVCVPQQYVENGKIVLNVSPVAVNSLVIDNRLVEFEARFRGLLESIHVPMHAVMAIYAKENGRGMAFDEEDEDHTPPPAEGGGAAAAGGFAGKGHLKVIK